MDRAVPTVAARAIAPIVMRLASGGVDTKAFLDRRGIELSLFSDDAARIPLERTTGIWEEAAELAADPSFGLHLAESMQASSFGLFSFLGVTSATWGVAVRRLCLYYKLISDVSGYDLTETGNIATFGALPWPGMPASRQLNEFSLAVVVGYGRRHLERPLEIRRATFTNRAPRDTSELARIFAAELAFDQPQNAFSFDSSWLAEPLRSADPKLSAILEPSADAELSRLDPLGERISQRVRTELPRLLRERIPTVVEVARRLALSPRSLQRRLTEEGTSFRALLLEAQTRLAERLLVEPGLSIAEVAVLLGFSETAAFHRSFQRMTGSTPGQFRAARGLR